MKLLAIDTSLAACSVAVADTAQDIPLASAFLPMERGHAEALAPTIASAMNDAGLSIGELDRIAVTIGPGTFTGVRIGLAMARGLGLALSIPVVGLDSLTAIAANDPEAERSLVVVDARNDEVYATCRDASGGSLLPPQLIRIADLVGHLPSGPARVLGSAAETLMAASGRTDLCRSMAGDLPNAANFAKLAAVLPQPAVMPVPLYLRAPDAKPQPSPRDRIATFRLQHPSPTDAVLLATLHAACFDHSWDIDAFTRMMSMPGTMALVATSADRQPTGFVLLRQAADEAEILTIGTMPAFRRRGIARRLIDEAVQELLAAKVAKLFIEVAATSAPARSLYAACGFREVGTRRNYYDRGGGFAEDAIVMTKTLAP